MDNAFKNLNSGRANFVLMVFICVIIGGGVLKITAPVVLPLVIAILLAFVLYPIVLALEKIRVPRVISISLAVIIMFVALSIFGIVLFSSGKVIVDRFLQSEKSLTNIYERLAQIFDDLSYDDELSFFQNVWGQFGVGKISSVVVPFFNDFMGFAKNALLVVLFVAFLLVEAFHFNDKLDVAYNKRSDTIKKMGSDIISQVTRYLGAKFLISLANGVIFAVSFKLVGLEHAIVWGLIQFLLNFIPTLGSIAAGAGISFFALLQFWPDKPMLIVIVVLIVLVTNMVLGNIIDPKIIGDNVGISPFVILVSLVIWGWIWGFAGMVLAVPMMVIIRIICENFPFLEPISILLGSRKSVLIKKAALEAAAAGEAPTSQI